ncbi:MAG: hypothetical protein ABW168_11240 [Sedimenticola sp.]
MIVRRYMDFASYAFILQNSGLHCARGDQFEDKFEGSYPLKNKDDFSEYDFNNEDWKKFAIISCWNHSEHESDAMWRLYGLTKNSIAIETTYDSLKKLAVDNTANLCTVKYIDYIQDKAPILMVSDVFEYKRSSFSHESELRIIKFKYPPEPIVNGTQAVSRPREGEEMPKKGKLFEVDLNSFITKVIISPYADMWFYDVVKKLTACSGVKKKLVNHSELRRDPVYGPN